MPQITEFFVVRLTDESAARRVRKAARPVFLALEGVRDWSTYRSVDEDRPTLFIETFSFDDSETARAAGEKFSILAETKAFLSLVEEMIVGQHFVELTKE